MSEANPWTTLGSTSRFEDDFFAVDDHEVVNPAGRRTRYGVVRFKNVGLRILPIDSDGSTLLVGQWRYAAGYFSWELPAGNQEADEDSAACARRELREEVGRNAASWLPLMEIVPSGSLTTQRERSFLAWDLEETKRDLDEQEVIRVKRVAFAEAVRMALAGEIKDAGSIVALLAVQMRLAQGALPDALLAALRSG